MIFSRRLNAVSDFSETKSTELFQLKQLEFESEKILHQVRQRCVKAIKEERIDRRQKWLGAFYAKEIQAGLTANNLEVRWIDASIGYGVFATKPIAKSTFIGEYLGVIKKKQWWNKKPDNGYCFEYAIGDELRSPFIIDAKESSNITRFINHRSQPNLESAAAYYDGLIHVILFAKQSIEVGEEIGYDYGEDYWSSRKNQLIPSNSISKINVALGGMTLEKPASP